METAKEKIVAIIQQELGMLTENVSERLADRIVSELGLKQMVVLPVEKERKYTFRMLIGLDEERMRRDGLDAEEKWKEIEELVDGIEDLYMNERGVIETNDSGSRVWLDHCLEEKEWFMKYVNRWYIDDPTIQEDVIKEYQEMGIRCSYE